MKLSLAELQQVIATYVNSTKIASVEGFNATKNNIVGLIDKIGKIVSLDTTFYDKLEELDGERLPFGKTIEEYFLDLIMPVDYSLEDTENKALRFYSITHRPVSYSYSLGRKYIPVSIPNDDIERAINNEEQYNNIVSTMTKRISDSRAVYKYGLKREVLGDLASKVKQAYTPEDAISNMEGEILVEGKTYEDDNGDMYIAVKTERVAEGGAIASELVENGFLVKLDMLREVEMPTDTTTGEAFVKAVKKDIEIAQDISEGHSLNGNTIGAEMGLRLYVKQGVIPELEVDTYAGAFNRKDLAMPAEIKVIKDFGKKAPEGLFAMLVDYRGVKLHTDYEATRENFNGQGDFVNLFAHSEYTAFVSRNTFVTIFVKPQE